ncbi:MAG: hypothetical protein IJW03_00535 [Clostridia bacterium]|nr:hypothetical protein [Clostridia bacterium]
MTIAKKILSLGLILTVLVSLFSVFSISASAASVGQTKSCITYNSMGKNAGKTSYRTEYYYSVEKNEKLTLKCYWGSSTLKNQSFAGLKLKNYLRFDVHIIDAQTNKVVNYWYGLKPEAKFKVYSSVPSINRKTYTVKVTSYLSNYKTYTDSDLVWVAARLKYKLQ